MQQLLQWMLPQVLPGRKLRLERLQVCYSHLSTLVIPLILSQGNATESAVTASTSATGKKGKAAGAGAASGGAASEIDAILQSLGVGGLNLGSLGLRDAPVLEARKGKKNATDVAADATAATDATVSTCRLSLLLASPLGASMLHLLYTDH